VNLWDPHTPYRAPASFGEPFADAPIETWYTEEIRRAQWNSFGPGTPQEIGGDFGFSKSAQRYPRTVDQITSLADYKKWIDGYDTGTLYADRACGRILNALADAGVLDDTVVIITSDHGENQGELGVIGDHATADHATSRVPMILRWPGMGPPRVDDALHYQTDVAATIVDLVAQDSPVRGDAGPAVPPHWDGRSFAEAFKAGRSQGRQFVVFSQCCWSCMRGVRWGDNLFIRTYHTGLKNLPARMLFDVAADPHETHDLAAEAPPLAEHGAALIERWTDQMMRTSRFGDDPMWTVMREGGPWHTRAMLEKYCQRLRDTGRAHHAEFLEKNPTGIEPGI
jgi:arylsulfatase A-like enzyme